MPSEAIKHAAYIQDRGIEEIEAHFGMDDSDWSSDDIAGMAPAETEASFAAGR